MRIKEIISADEVGMLEDALPELINQDKSNMEDSEYYKELMEKHKDVKISKVIVTSQDENGKWSSKVKS